MVQVGYGDFWECVEFSTISGKALSDRPNPDLLALRADVVYRAGGYFELPTRCLSAFLGRAAAAKDCEVYIPVAFHYQPTHIIV
jgi:hypothetical protein